MCACAIVTSQDVQFQVKQVNSNSTVHIRQTWNFGLEKTHIKTQHMVNVNHVNIKIQCLVNVKTQRQADIKTQRRVDVRIQHCLVNVKTQELFFPYRANLSFTAKFRNILYIVQP